VLSEEKDLIKPVCMVGMLLLKISTAKRYPMMAERQVVIVKAQDLSYHRQAGS
jgi:hypothetical protein